MLTIRFGSDFIINSPDKRSHYSLRCNHSLLEMTGCIRLRTQTWKGCRRLKDTVSYLSVAGQYESYVASSW